MKSKAYNFKSFESWDESDHQFCKAGKKEEVEKIVTKSGGNDISFIENFISNYQIIKKFH